MTFKQMQIHKTKIFFWYTAICTLVVGALTVSWLDPYIGSMFTYYGMYKAFQAIEEFENNWFDGQFENIFNGSELSILNESSTNINEFLDKLHNTPVIKNNSDLLVNKLRGVKAVGSRPDLLILDDIVDDFDQLHNLYIDGGTSNTPLTDVLGSVAEEKQLPTVNLPLDKKCTEDMVRISASNY